MREADLFMFMAENNLIETEEYIIKDIEDTNISYMLFTFYCKKCKEVRDVHISYHFGRTMELAYIRFVLSFIIHLKEDIIKS